VPNIDMAAILTSLDAWQRRHSAVAFPVAVVRKFLDDRASNLAALVTYYAFFSVFPLVLVFVSILGYLLQDDPTLRNDIVDSALGRIPVIGTQLDNAVEPLTGSSIALAVGLATALWAGLGVMLALTRAFEQIWDVPRLEQHGVLAARARGVVVLLALGVGLIASTIATGSVVTGSIGPGVQQVGAFVVSFALNALMFFVTFGVLNARSLRIGEIAPGVVLAALGSLALQSLGGWYVTHAVERASDVYGTFAAVIGLLSWFWLGSNLLLFSAEVNVVLHRRLWPRSLTGSLSPADREALRDAAAAARQDERQEIEVRFSEDGAQPDRAPADEPARRAGP
jgi:YihY family inner membrane protein